MRRLANAIVSIPNRTRTRLATVVALVIMMLMVGSPAQAQTEDAVFNLASADCLDHSSFGTGLYAYVYRCNGLDNQAWTFARFKQVGEGLWTYLIINAKSGKCLDHESYGQGLHAILWDCLGTDNQLWEIGACTPSGFDCEVVNLASFKCLDQSDNGTGLLVILWTCTSANNQKWGTLGFPGP